MRKAHDTLTGISDVPGLGTALGNKEDAGDKGQPDGYAALDSGGKVPLSQLPSSGMGAEELNDLSDVDVTSPAADHFLKHDGTSFKNVDAAAVRTALGVPTTSDVDALEASDISNDSSAAGANVAAALDGLASGVGTNAANISTNTSDIGTNTSAISVNASAISGKQDALTSVNDVPGLNVNSPQDGEILQYDSSTSEFKNVTLASAGLVDESRTISTTGPLTGGGDLSQDRTLSMPAADGVSQDGYLTSAKFAEFDAKEDASNKGQAGGYAGLDGTSGAVPLAQGGTNANDAAGARVSLDVPSNTELTTSLAGKSDVGHSHDASDITSGVLPLGRGGTNGYIEAHSDTISLIHRTPGLGSHHFQLSSGSPTAIVAAYAFFTGLSEGMLKLNSSFQVTNAAEGTDFYGPGGSDVAITDGGTGASDAAGARANLGAQQQDELLDDIVAMTVSPGDILYVNDTSHLVRLPKGNSGQILVMNSAGNAPEWTNVGGTSGDFRSLSGSAMSLSSGSASTWKNLEFNGSQRSYGSTVSKYSTNGLQVSEAGVYIASVSASYRPGSGSTNHLELRFLLSGSTALETSVLNNVESSDQWLISLTTTISMAANEYLNFQARHTNNYWGANFDDGYFVLTKIS